MDRRIQGSTDGTESRPRRRGQTWLWPFLAMFVSIPLLLWLYSTEPAARPSEAMRERLQPIYAKLRAEEERARADQAPRDPAGMTTYFGLDDVQRSLPRHPAVGDANTVGDLESYAAWVEAVMHDHDPVRRAELDASDLKKEEKMHRQLTAPIDERFAPLPRFVLPHWFYHQPFLLLLIPILFVSTFALALGPVVQMWLLGIRLRRSGVRMRAEVLAVDYTGTRINGQPMMHLQVRLETGEVAEYDKVYGFGVALVAGMELEVLVDPSDHSKVVGA